MSPDSTITRKDALRAMLVTAAASAMPASLFAQGPEKPAGEITLEDLKAIEKAAGLQFTDEERKAILNDVRGNLREFQTLRAIELDQKVLPALVHEPPGAGSVERARIETKPARVSVRKGLSDEDLAFLSARELGELIRTRQVTSVRLTELYLERLRRFDPKLKCVVSLTPERAMAAARRADAEIARGRYRGPLHGLPYGIKDLFAVRGTKTTWGATPYKDQVIDEDAEVVRRLDEAGAVLVAKLTSGALALNDVWFGGRTNNPWNLEQGSSGSSAGPAAATAAGLVAFSIGTETQGSIVSPAWRCRTTGFRPSFGRISRAGCMELSYTMDKVGPICRTIEDCALVFAALCGEDAKDPATVNQPFRYAVRRDVRGLKVGYMAAEARMDSDPVVRILREGGAEVRHVRFTAAPSGIGLVLDVECAAAFDELTRSDRIDLLTENQWPQWFRAGRHVPAVEYVRAQRARRLVGERFLREFGDLDVVVDEGPSYGILSITNQTGTPQAIIPWGADDKGNGLSKSFHGKLYADDLVLEVADYVQRRADFHRLRPGL